MRFKLLGKSGLRVSELCLGAMTFGEAVSWGAPKSESRKIFDTFLEAGGNFIDTANNYTEGQSEQFLGEFIADKRDSLVLATKYTQNWQHGDPNASGNHRKNMIQSLEGSLKRLKTDYVDLFWLHSWDFMTPVEEVLRAFDDLVRAGKVRYIGLSDTPAWVVSQANTIAHFQGWTPFVGLQIRYNLADRTAERDLLPMARAFDLGVTCWGVQASGVLSGKYLKDESATGRAAMGGRKLSDRNRKISQAVIDLAEEIGCTPSQVAINYVCRQPGVMLPIVGARTADQLKDNLGAVEHDLTAEQIARLNEAAPLDLGFPHDFLSHAKGFVYGGTFDQIDNHRKIMER